MEGYIKIHRSIWDWEWCDDAPTVLLWLYLLSMANYEDKRWHGIVIRRGQLVVSVDSIRKKLKLSTKQIRTRLERLVEANQIVKETTNRFTLLTICNYDKYQCCETSEGQTKDKQEANKGQTKGNYIRSKEGEEYNTNTTTTTRTHVREFDTEAKLDILRELYKNTTWTSDTGELLCMPEDTVKELITKFALEIKTSDTDDSRNEAELLAHLKSYLRLQKRMKENGSSNTDRSDKRRGTLATATSASEYTETF